MDETHEKTLTDIIHDMQAEIRELKGDVATLNDRIDYLLGVIESLQTRRDSAY